VIESAGDFLDREILRIVYNCMLSGMKRQQIAIYLEISRDSVDKLRSHIKAQIRLFPNFCTEKKRQCKMEGS